MRLPVTYKRTVSHGLRTETVDVAAELAPASQSGYWNVWPTPRGNALATMIPRERAARMFPEHAEAILSRPDSSD